MKTTIELSNGKTSDGYTESDAMKKAVDELHPRRQLPFGGTIALPILGGAAMVSISYYLIDLIKKMPK